LFVGPVGAGGFVRDDHRQYVMSLLSDRFGMFGMPAHEVPAALGEPILTAAGIAPIANG
jgi:uncharacterized membrane protein YdcZ (DUF606 family)